jgi:hypothetical protein
VALLLNRLALVQAAGMLESLSLLAVVRGRNELLVAAGAHDDPHAAMALIKRAGPPGARGLTGDLVLCIEVRNVNLGSGARTIAPIVTAVGCYPDGSLGLHRYDALASSDWYTGHEDEGAADGASAPAPAPALDDYQAGVLRFIGRQSSGSAHWRSIALAFPPDPGEQPRHVVREMDALARAGLVTRVSEGSWSLTAAGTRVAGEEAAPVVRRRTISRTLQQLAITLRASFEWQDTGLQPDVLATRGLLVGYTIKLLWNVRPIPGARIEPVLELRHVPDPSFATRDTTFGFKPPAGAPPVIPSMTAVRLVAGANLRFPREPGRIEARIAGAAGTEEIFQVAGYYRLELLAHVAGDADVPLRAPVYTVQIIGSDDFDPLPALPTEEPRWQPFAHRL